MCQQKVLSPMSNFDIMKNCHMSAPSLSSAVQSPCDKRSSLYTQAIYTV